MKTRRVRFDLDKAKKGAKIITRDKRPVRILDYNLKSIDTPIVAAVMGDTYEHAVCYKINGKHECRDLYEYDLFIEEEVKTRRMTNQELAWWLRDSPEEHRECSMLNEDCGVFDRHIYYDEDANKPVKDGIIIRKNGGEWEEPLVEI